VERDWDTYVGKWKVFISQVETGYKYSIYDYTNDLSARDILEELTEKAPPEQQAGMKAALQTADRCFQSATNHTEQPLTVKPQGQTAGWWWSRIPKKLEGELQEDIASL